jgi:hypothetical protein
MILERVIIHPQDIVERTFEKNIMPYKWAIPPNNCADKMKLTSRFIVIACT